MYTRKVKKFITGINIRNYIIVNNSSRMFFFSGFLTNYEEPKIIDSTADIHKIILHNISKYIDLEGFCSLLYEPGCILLPPIEEV